MNNQKYPFSLKLTQDIIITIICIVVGILGGLFYDTSGILQLLVIVVLILALLSFYWLIRYIYHQKTVIKNVSSNQKNTSTNSKKKLPLYFPLNKTISNNHSSWSVRVESRFGLRNEDIENFIYNMDISGPFCSECDSNFVLNTGYHVSDYFVCKNNSCKNCDLGWEVDSEREDGKDLLNSFIGEVRNNQKKWIKIYRDEFLKYTGSDYDDFEPPKIIRGIP